MLYFATASGPKVHEAMSKRLLGQIATPAAGNRVLPDVDWIADNAVFAGRYPGNDAYLAWLSERAEHSGRCQFAVAPGVVGDAEATLARSDRMLPKIRMLGFWVALVAQDGLERLSIPWADIDCLFIGGTTEWKLGVHARGLAAEAREQGKWVHMGRVNSLERLRYARYIGCDSVDGTYLAFGPDKNLPKLLRWLAEVNDQGLLWEAS